MKTKLFAVILSFLLAGCMQSATEEVKPNILFCIMDDASVHMGAYGYKWVNTPAFDRLASEGCCLPMPILPMRNVPLQDLRF
jgi:N-sulfoglucosamine sulfohydrolase